ncbi:MAG: hypothetical protein QMD71_05105 [bacterium]|nr:hypothetical protein [bacterium]
MRKIKGLIGCVAIGLMMVWIVDSEGARPFATDDAGTVENTGYELEFGCNFWKKVDVVDISFKHGATEKMDIGVGFGYTFESKDFTGAKLCLKYAIIPDLFSVSINNEFGNPDYSLNGIFARSLGPIEVDANFGYSTEEASVTYGVALISCKEKFDLGSEILSDKKWLIGIRCRLLEKVAIDLGLSGNFEMKENISTVGLHYEF